MKLLIKFGLVILLILSLPFLIADMGPKPSADFEIIYETQSPPELTGYDLYLCDTADCSYPQSLEDVFMYFECDQHNCKSWGYGYPEYMYITFDFADGATLTSNFFTKKHFDAEFEILVGSESLEVTETGGSNFGRLGGPLGWVIYGSIAAAVSGGILIITAIILIIVLIIRKRRKKQAAAE